MNLEQRSNRIFDITALIVAATMVIIGLGLISSTILTNQKAKAFTIIELKNGKAPIAMDGNNVYTVWSSNKSGDWEVFFKVSTDGGKTFGPEIDLSNSKGIISNDAQVAAHGDHVYVTWWEKTDKSNEPMMRISTDNGKSFGNVIKLSSTGNSTSNNSSSVSG